MTDSQQTFDHEESGLHIEDDLAMLKDPGEDAPNQPMSGAELAERAQARAGDKLQAAAKNLEAGVASDPTAGAPAGAGNVLTFHNWSDDKKK